MDSHFPISSRRLLVCVYFIGKPFPYLYGHVISLEVPKLNNNNNNNNNKLIGVAISGDRNVIKKEAEKVLKYNELTI